MEVMSQYEGRREGMASTPEPNSQSDEDIESSSPTYHTVATLPLHRPQQSLRNDTEQETLAPIMELSRGHGIHQTQPTQILSPASPDSLFCKSPVVQVAASSPAAPPARKPSILASAIAPAGTAFRRPFVPAQMKSNYITIDSDDEGPTYKGGSSDSDDTQGKNDIRPSSFGRRTNTAERVEESPQPGKAKFQAITASSFYKPGQPLPGPAFNPSQANGVKRSSDMMANAYGNVSKKPRQLAPSRAVPVVIEEPDMDIEDIRDPNIRQKVKKIREFLPDHSIRACHDALLLKKGHWDDTLDYLADLGEKNCKPKHIDLTGSDDELLMTPVGGKFSFAPTRSYGNPPVRQEAKKPARTIQEKWASTQNPVRHAPVSIAPAPKKLAVFNTPEPTLKKRTLVRGRKDPSSPLAEIPKPRTQVTQIDSDEESEDAGSGINTRYEETSFQLRLLEFFNTCTASDLTDIASIPLNLATYLISKRPFRSLGQVEKVEAPNTASTNGKTKRKVAPVGEKIRDKCREMLAAYEAVDYLVQRCENIAKPINLAMKSWGVDLHGSNQDGELAMVSLRDSQRSLHDSGIGTPVSDEEVDLTKPKMSSGKFFGQPALMGKGVNMKDYQIVGVNWLNLLYQKGHSCILADDMGLGKTCQVIAFIAHLLETGQKGPHLIVVPAATLENWLQEFKKFCPNIRVEPYYAPNPTERAEMRWEIDEAKDNINVLVTTYTIAKAKEDLHWLKNFGFCCTIFDEGHALKNAGSKVAQQLSRIESEFRLLLTGTPLQNNLKELISLLAFLMPKTFKDKAEELESIFTHNVKAMDENHEALLSGQRIARARSMLTPFILRRKKNQVLKDLPKKERRVEYCAMTPQQQDIYNNYINKALDIRQRRANGESGANESANVLMRLRQSAIHPFMFRRLYPDDILPIIAKQCTKIDLWAASNPSLIVKELTAYSDMEIHTLCDKHTGLRKFVLNDLEWLASGKVQKALELLRKWMAEGHRTLVFSQFTMVLDILELVFEREAIAYFRLDGNTKVSERQDLIDEFSADDNDTPVFMLSTKAGGAGINLAKANKVIVFDSGFNPQDDIQAENRAHRIGQVKEVEVVRLVSKNTVEEQIYSMGLTKLKLDEQVAGDEDGESRKAAEKKEEEGLRAFEEAFFKKLEEEPKAAFVKAETGAVEKTKMVEEDVVSKAMDDVNTSSQPRATRKPSRGKKEWS